MAIPLPSSGPTSFSPQMLDAKRSQVADMAKSEGGKLKYPQEFQDYMKIMLKLAEPSGIDSDSHQAEKFAEHAIQGLVLLQQTRSHETQKQYFESQNKYMMINGAGLIDQTVRVKSDRFDWNASQGDIPEVSYTIPPLMKNARLMVFNSNDMIVDTYDADHYKHMFTHGDHAWRFEGKSSSGKDLPDGKYRIELIGDSELEKNVQVETLIKGRVSEMQEVAGSHKIRMGTQEYDLADVRGLAHDNSQRESRQNLMVSTASMIDKMVTVRTGQFKWDPQSTDKPALSYTTPGGMKDASVAVFDAQNKCVKMVTAHDNDQLLNPGQKTWTFDGMDAKGKTLPSGSYRVEVSFEDTKGNHNLVDTYVKGRVAQVEEVGGRNFIQVNNNRYDVSALKSIQSNGQKGEENMSTEPKIPVQETAEAEAPASSPEPDFSFLKTRLPRHPSGDDNLPPAA